MKTNLVKLIATTLLPLVCATMTAQDRMETICGKIISEEGEIVDFAGIALKGTTIGCTPDAKGQFSLNAPEGGYTLEVSAVGYRTEERVISVRGLCDVGSIVLKVEKTSLEEALVTASGVGRVRKSAFNAVAIDAGTLKNTTKTLGEALAGTPGLRLRESGGVGSDLTMMMDGFSGKHIKVFIDGIPQEGVGESFSLNNIPVGFAERIEVYKGVVPVGFGTDALGGIINIVTSKHPAGWSLDASYSYGSFNTHKSDINFSYTSKKGLLVEITAFQNYSDNNYTVDTPVEEFLENGMTRYDTSVSQRVKRFNDTYHNEAVAGKIGIVERKWADRLVAGFTGSNMYKEIQTGVIQKVVFGKKHRRGFSLMPSLEYSKRNLLTRGLDISFTANYNRNTGRNIDTSTFRYNWLGQEKYQNGTVGEQSFQDRRMDNDNFNTTLTLNYRFAGAHTFTLSNVFNWFRRKNTPAEGTVTSQADEFAKLTAKDILGVSYTFRPSLKWNVSAFGKYYHQKNSGPVSTSGSLTSDFILLSGKSDCFGFGAAGTWHFLKGAQMKISYERAVRLPSTDELFGDEDLELGTIGLRPEKSDNVNFNLSYTGIWGRHSLYAEGGFVFRNTTDFIQRRIGTYSGNKSYASYENHGKVRTLGYTLALRYDFHTWVSIGGCFTQMDARDNVKTLNEGSAQENITYGDRIPNQPYLYANADLTLRWKDIWGKGNDLSLTCDSFYQHEFPLYSESLGSKQSKEYVPSQFSHNLCLNCSLKGGKYNLSFECRNFTNEKLYDNFSLQKPGRAFYGKLRVRLGNMKHSASRRGGHHRNHQIN